MILSVEKIRFISNGIVIFSGLLKTFVCADLTLAYFEILDLEKEKQCGLLCSKMEHS